MFFKKPKTIESIKLPIPESSKECARLAYILEHSFPHYLGRNRRYMFMCNVIEKVYQTDSDAVRFAKSWVHKLLWETIGTEKWSTLENSLRYAGYPYSDHDMAQLYLRWIFELHAAEREKREEWERSLFP